MSRLIRALGSIKIAVPLLIVIAAILAWGTVYEARFGTAAVQRFIYQSGWFQAILVFLAVNLAVAALERLPWKRRHIPFVLAHIGIILLLTGGILGGRLGIEGQLIVREGESSGTLQAPGNVLAMHQPDSGLHQEFATRFESTAWVHRVHARFETRLEDKPFQMVVDRYYPNAVREEEITGDGTEENPAVRVEISHEGQEEAFWLFAGSPDRFAVRWGDAHLFFLDPEGPEQLKQLL